MDYAGRREKLRKLLKQSGAPALLVTSAANVTYLTGFTGDSSYLLVTEEKEVLVSDGRYSTQIEEECPGLEMDIRRPGVAMDRQTARILRAAHVSKLAIEAESMTVATFQEIAEKLPRLQIGFTSGIVEQLRQIKDADELALIRRAVWIAEKSFAVIRAESAWTRRKRRLAMPWNVSSTCLVGTGRRFRRLLPWDLGRPCRTPSSRIAALGLAMWCSLIGGPSGNSIRVT